MASSTAACAGQTAACSWSHDAVEGCVEYRAVMLHVGSTAASTCCDSCCMMALGPRPQIVSHTRQGQPAISTRSFLPLLFEVNMSGACLYHSGFIPVH